MPTTRFGVGAGGGDHGDAALYRVMVAVKAVHILVSVSMIPLLENTLPDKAVADENTE